MTSIRKAKKLGIYKPPKKVDKKLLNETRTMIEKVNKRLRNLEKGGNYNSYASKKLFTRLDAKSLGVLQRTKKGRKIRAIKLNPRLTNTDLHAIQKASRQFLKSATSTSRGIERVAISTKTSMLKTLNIDPNMEVSKKDVEDYYDMLSSSDFDYFNEKIGASAMWGLMEDAKDLEMDENQFVNLLDTYMVSLDEDARNKALRLYNKYIV